MPSVSYAGFLLAVAALVSGPVSAQNGAQNGALNGTQNGTLKKPQVQQVIVRGTGDAMEVEIQTSGATITPDTQAITGPDRIVVDFPGALPAAELRALTVNRGALKGVRSGLFFRNPPITRVVLDLTEPQSYQISTVQNAIVVKLNRVKPNRAELNPAAPNPVAPGSAKLDAEKSGPVTPGRPVKSGPVKPGSVAAAGKEPDVPAAHAAKLQTASLVGSTNAASPHDAASGVSAVVSPTTAPPLPAVSAVLKPMPLVAVTFANGMLRIRAENATLSEVLFEVQRQTRAEIAIPAGAEREQVMADLGPAPAREVLAALLNGSAYNFIFIGNELDLQQVILTLRQPGTF